MAIDEGLKPIASREAQVFDEANTSEILTDEVQGPLRPPGEGDLSNLSFSDISLIKFVIFRLIIDFFF